MIHVIGTNEACNRYEWIMSHRSASWNIEKNRETLKKMTHFDFSIFDFCVICFNVSRFFWKKNRETLKQMTHFFQCFICLHFAGKTLCFACTYLFESCRTSECAVSLVTRNNASRHTHEWVMITIHNSHATHTNESRNVYAKSAAY